MNGEKKIEDTFQKELSWFQIDLLNLTIDVKSEIFCIYPDNFEEENLCAFMVREQNSIADMSVPQEPSLTPKDLSQSNCSVKKFILITTGSTYSYTLTLAVSLKKSLNERCVLISSFVCIAPNSSDSPLLGMACMLLERMLRILVRKHFWSSSE